MKNILSLFILVWLLSLNVFGATKERIIREDSFLGQKVLFCRDGNYTYYVRTENSVILAWPWTKEGASGCYFGKNQIYIECRYVLGAARGPGVVSTVLKIDSGTLSRLPKIPFPAPDTELRKRFPDLTAEEGVCNAVFKRQQAVEEIVPRSDAVIIAGSSHSSNANRMRDVAIRMGKAAFLIDSAEDLPDLSAFRRIALGAGASTPDESVQEILDSLLKLGYRNVTAEE